MLSPAKGDAARWAINIEPFIMGMMNVPEMRRMTRVQRFDFWIAVTAIVATLVFGVLAGVRSASHSRCCG